MKQLLHNISNVNQGHIIMYIIGLILIYLAIKKDYEPMLLLPIGFGAILVNIPNSSALGTPEEPGILQFLYNVGITTELFPVLIFIAIGAMIDFTPLFKTPLMVFFGAAAQFGIFGTLLLAVLFGFSLNEAGAIAIIGSADGPTSILVANKLAKYLLPPITVAAYSYMALVPIIQPPIIKILTTKKERMIRMDYEDVEIPRKVYIIFPIIVTIISGIIAPMSVALVGLLMFGNLIRECGVLERLSKSAQNELANLVTLLLGITIGSTMTASAFLTKSTIIILVMGLVAFALGTAGGVIFAKILNLFLKNKINPMVGAAGLSSFPMSARIVQKMAAKEDPTNFILMQAISANVSGQLGSVIAGGVLLSVITQLIR